jgi:uridylate kinase
VDAPKPAWRRILLKLSGEALAGAASRGLDVEVCRAIAAEIVDVRAMGVQIGIVIGGGNFMRGASVYAIPRVTADTMGMLATVMNSLALAEFIKELGSPCRVMTAVGIEGAGEYFSGMQARDYLDKGDIVIIAGGTGNPFFTTDTAAALRAAEIGADVLLKATKVDGIYDSDPMKNPDAVKFPRLTHAEALSRRLGVMDATAFSFCMENKIPIIVFKMAQAGNLRTCLGGGQVGSIITAGGA